MLLIKTMFVSLSFLLRSLRMFSAISLVWTTTKIMKISIYSMFYKINNFKIIEIKNGGRGAQDLLPITVWSTLKGVLMCLELWCFMYILQSPSHRWRNWDPRGGEGSYFPSQSVAKVCSSLFKAQLECCLPCDPELPSWHLQQSPPVTKQGLPHGYRWATIAGEISRERHFHSSPHPVHQHRAWPWLQ